MINEVTIQTINTITIKLRNQSFLPNGSKRYACYKNKIRAHEFNSLLDAIAWCKTQPQKDTEK